ncbi:hypothetical protein [Schlesneria sp. T3-172]|uniref:hypothetical protein n=1 Tax=Schlesneria sphaerica TaxID=3373610 RepID=UPI0037C7B78C
MRTWSRKRQPDVRVPDTAQVSLTLELADSLKSTLRRGSVLLLVVVVIAMLTLAAYNFAQSMMTELEAASMYALDVQAKATADSGVEFVASLLGSRNPNLAENLIHNPQLFMGRVVSPSTHLRANGRFTIIAPIEQDPRGAAIRYGLMDESAKLNLNHLLDMKMSHDEISAMMIRIPGMTVDIIDAILDWMDTDDTKNPYGAESETYEQMVPPYRAKNGPFESIDELLLVNGITPTLLYGEDANRNGLLDPNENDGDASHPLDNSDGILDHGFMAYLTVSGGESNRRKDGTLKINVNDGFLTDLYDALEKEFDENTAKFIVAYRINGPSTKLKESQTNPLVPPDAESTKLSNTEKASSPNAKPADDAASSSTSDSGQSQQEKEVAAGLSEFLGWVARSGGEVTRGGIDLSKGGQSKGTINSLWQLIGAKTKVTINGKEEELESPWEDDPAAISAVLPDLLTKLTTTTDEIMKGRININQARRELLLGLPSMTEEIANAIIAAQRLDSNGQPSLETIRQHSNTSWLYTENLVDLPGMINLDPYITATGDVFRVQVLGFFDGGGPVSRIEATIDSSQLPPRIISQRDLDELGRGYSRAQLLPVATGQ